jgi:hypothetical protein
LKYLCFSFTIEPEDEKMASESGKKVFISYSFPRDTEGEGADSMASDQRVADQICHRLESESIDCWIAPRALASVWPGLSNHLSIANCKTAIAKGKMSTL